MSLRLLLKQHYEHVYTERNPHQIPSLLQDIPFDVILLDMNFSAGINSGNEGLFWLKRIAQAKTDAAVILITAYGDVEIAVKAMKEGGYDFVLKPWDNEKLLETVNAAYEGKRIKAAKNSKRNDSIAPPTFIGQSSVMQQVFRTIDKVAATDANVLIMGENGTGKELVARALHTQSNRANKPFVAVDMGALSESLFESELFGHVKGAFTDAKEDRAGRFEAANGGTLFLDEIGNLSPAMQAKLLTALQNRTITRIGSNKVIPVDIRLVCATNMPLLDMVEKKTFREDLLYRINTIQIDLPPLRERQDDIKVLAEHYLVKSAEKYQKNFSLSKDALQKLAQYYWPGNVRELQHTIEKAAILNDRQLLTADDFHFNTNKKNETINSLNLEDVERDTIQKAIRKHHGNLSTVAKELGISRSTLYCKIEKHGL